MRNKELITHFYQSFVDKDAEAMSQCYHEDAQFEDPAFGILNSREVKAMWAMLIQRAGDDLKIEYQNIQESEIGGTAEWKAEYIYGPSKRKVLNHVTAKFEINEAKITKHIDEFDMWKWTKQALGLPGYLLGWSAYLKKKIRKRTRVILTKFIEKQGK